MTLASQLAQIPNDATRNALTEIFSGAGYLLTDNITGYATKAKTGTAANAVAATGTLTINGVVIDGETITIGSRIYEFDTDGSIMGGRTAVDISASAVAGTGVLTISGVVDDTETVTIGTEVYEFDTSGTVTGGRIAVDISSYAVAAQGTLTFTGAPAHSESFAVDGVTWTFKSDGTAGGSGVIDISSYTVKGSAVLSFGGSVADAQTVTINSRVYEFDTNSSITGDVAVDVSGGATKDLAGAALANAINADGSAVVTAEYNAAANELTVTAKAGGTVGNYTTAENATNLSWSGNLTGGTNCTAANAVIAIVADFDSATVTAAAGAGTTVIFTAVAAGAPGSLLTFTKSITNASVDGAGTLGGTTEGTSCSATDAATALIAAITAQSAIVTAATGGAGVVNVTHKVPGSAGNVVSQEACANASWGAGNLASGADCAKGNAQTAIRTRINATETDWQLGTFSGDAATLTAQTKGIALNGVATTKSGVNITWGAAVTAGGIDGTVGAANDVLADSSYIYVCTGTNTVADANWKRSAITTF